MFHQQNKGLSGAWNKGLEACTGEYIGFVDEDDWIKEDMYDYLYRILKENKADIAVCGCHTFFPRSRGTYYLPFTVIERYLKICNIKEYVFGQNENRNE